MMIQTFETEVASGERGRVFINLPFTPQAVWGKAVRYVKGTLNGGEFHASIGVRAGQYFMPLNKELQQVATLKAGDGVKVTMEPDEAQLETMPEDFDQALKADPKVWQFYEAPTAFQRNIYLEWINDAKKAETRATRIQESVQRLQAGQKQR